MSKPSAGEYIIYNRVLSPAGEKLALHFNGQDKTVTVKPLDKSGPQIWKVADFDGRTQSISPKDSERLQAAWGNGVVTVLPAGAYVWTIRSSDAGYTIQDGKVTVYWGVRSANVNSEASIGPDQPDATQRWVLEKL